MVANVGQLPDPVLFTAGTVALLGVVTTVEFAVRWCVKAAREALT